MKFLLLSIVVVFLTIQAEAGVTNHLLSWGGGWCTICDGDVPLNHNYACSNNHGTWNEGQHIFVDAVPAGNIVTGVKITLRGVWDCTGLPNSDVRVELQGNEVEAKTLFGQCQCKTCDPEAVFEWTDTTCFPDYAYGGANNLIQIIVTSGTICVEEALIEITYELGDPQNCGQFIPTCDYDCGDHGTCVIDWDTLTAECKCEEEWYGPDCSCNIPSYHLLTDKEVIMDVAESGFKEKDVMTLVFYVTAKYYDTVITFKNSEDNFCDFPIASMGVTWTRTFLPDTCEFKLVGKIPWTVAWPTCVFKRVVEPDWLVFTGEAEVHNLEDVGQLGTRPHEIIRTFEHDLRFVVRFPRYIAVSQTGVQVFADVDVLASITEQMFDSNELLPPGKARVKMLTSVQYPFQLTGPIAVSGDDTRFVMSVSGNTGNGGPECLDDPNDYCVQFWDFMITPKSGECNFDGDYRLDFKLKCKPSMIGDCPLDSDTDFGWIDFTLDSENFCARIIEDIDLSGQMTTYLEPARTTPKDDFLFDQTVYGKTSLSSSESTIVSTTIDEFWVTLWDNSIVTFYLAGATTGDGNTVNFIVQDNTGVPEDSHFQFVVNPSIFDVDVDSFESVDLHAIVNVKFLNTDPVKKRIVFNLLDVIDQEKTGKVDAITEVKMGNNKENSAMHTSTGILMLLLLSGFGMLMWI